MLMRCKPKLQGSILYNRNIIINKIYTYSLYGFSTYVCMPIYIYIYIYIYIHIYTHTVNLCNQSFRVMTDMFRHYAK